MKNKNKFLLAGLVVFLSVVVDQVTKLIALQQLQNTGYVPFLGNFVGFELVKNPGAFLGMFSQARWMFMIPSTLIIIVMSVWIWRKQKASPVFVLSLALLIGGGIGNMIDRIRLEYVIDFISFKWINFPNFNVADSCVTIGCVLFAIYALLPGNDLFSSLDKKDVMNNESVKND